MSNQAVRPTMELCETALATGAITAEEVAQTGVEARILGPIGGGSARYLFKLTHMAYEGSTDHPRAASLLKKLQAVASRKPHPVVAAEVDPADRAEETDNQGEAEVDANDAAPQAAGDTTPSLKECPPTPEQQDGADPVASVVSSTGATASRPTVNKPASSVRKPPLVPQKKTAAFAQEVDHKHNTTKAKPQAEQVVVTSAPPKLPDRVVLVPVNQLHPHPLSRKIYDPLGDPDWEAGVIEAARAGTLEPLIATPKGVIISGERRWRALKKAKVEHVPTIRMTVENEKVAIILYNRYRVKSTGERAREAEILEKELAKAAKMRQRAGVSADGTAGGRGRKNPRPGLVTGSKPATTRSRRSTATTVADTVGLKRETLRKILHVLQSSAAPADLKAQLEQDKISADAAYKIVLELEKKKRPSAGPRKKTKKTSESSRTHATREVSAADDASAAVTLRMQRALDGVRDLIEFMKDYRTTQAALDVPVADLWVEVMDAIDEAKTLYAEVTLPARQDIEPARTPSTEEVRPDAPELE